MPAPTRWKRVEAVLAWAGVIAWNLSWLVFTAIGPSRRAPAPELGRVYAWANHGGYVYFSRTEHYVLLSTLIGAGVLFLCAIFIDWRIDPYDRRERG